MNADDWTACFAGVAALAAVGGVVVAAHSLRAGVEHGSPYTLRHRFATRALAAGISVFELSRFMGTSVEMIDRTYGHLAQGSEAGAIAKLDALDRQAV